MPVEMGLWRVDDRPQRIAPQAMPLESKLEKLILDEPEILETKLLLLGSQVPTKYGKFIDVLGVDVEGVLHILELKRDRTPRDVVAQMLDYASWVQELGNDDVREVFERTSDGLVFDEAFAKRFDGAPVPDDLNSAHVMTIVASDLDTGTERIVSYLNRFHSVPINVMKFRYFNDNGHEYLARTWLVDEATAAPAANVGRNKSTKAAWNGVDWYVAFGDDHSRSWDDARSFGFVSAGGGDWHSKTLKSLPEGARISVHVPKRGYVGVGVVLGTAAPADDARLIVNGEERPFRSLDLTRSYRHAHSDSEDVAEYVVPVRWLSTIPLNEAFWRQGMFANQNSACKLRNQFTIEEISKAFSIPDAD